MTWFPRCMSDDEYAEWLDAARRSTRVGVPAVRPCEDCPAWFRRDALVAGRCNGYAREPGLLRHDEKRLIQWREAQARRRAGIRLRRSSEEVDALALQVRSMRAEGLSYSEIGRQLGTDHTYARDLAMRERAA